MSLKIFRNRKAAFIASGVLLLITAVTVPVAIIYRKPRPVFIDLNLNDVLPPQFDVKQINNGVRIQVNDDKFNNYKVNKIVFNDEDDALNLEGEESAVVDLYMRGSEIVANVFDVEKQAYHEQVLNEPKSWVYSALCYLTPLESSLVPQNLRPLDIDISAINAFLPYPLYKFIYSHDGVFLLLNKDINKYRIGNIFARGKKLVQDKDDVVFRTIHINNSNEMRVYDLFKGHHRLTYLSVVDPDVISPSFKNVLEKNTAAKFYLVDEFFRQNVLLAQRQLTFPAFFPENSMRFEMVYSHAYPLYHFLKVNDYLVIYPKSNKRIMGDIYVNNNLVVSLDQYSTFRAIVLYKNNLAWNLLVLDQYEEFETVVAGPFSLKPFTQMASVEAQLTKLFAKANPNVRPSYESNKKLNVIEKVESFLPLKADSSPYNLSYRQSQLSKINENFVYQELKLDNDELPRDVNVTADGKSVTLFTSSVVNGNILVIGDVHWDNQFHRANYQSVVRLVRVFRSDSYYKYYIVDLLKTFRFSFLGVFDVPAANGLPKWLSDRLQPTGLLDFLQSFHALTRFAVNYSFYLQQGSSLPDDVQSYLENINKEEEPANLRASENGDENALVKKSPNHDKTTISFPANTSTEIVVDLKSQQLHPALYSEYFKNTMVIYVPLKLNESYKIHSVVAGESEVFVNSENASIILICYPHLDSFMVNVYSKNENDGNVHVKIFEVNTQSPAWYQPPKDGVDFEIKKKIY